MRWCRFFSGLHNPKVASFFASLIRRTRRACALLEITRMVMAQTRVTVDFGDGEFSRYFQEGRHYEDQR